MGSFLHRYTVHSVPWFWKPFYGIYGYVLGFLGFLYCLLIHLTCRIDFRGDLTFTQNNPCIIVFWHQWAFTYFSVFLKHRQHVWLNSPHWYMRPIHVMIFLSGVEKIIYGASGMRGQEASDELV